MKKIFLTLVLFITAISFTNAKNQVIQDPDPDCVIEADKLANEISCENGFDDAQNDTIFWMLMEDC
jgi:hypothetical protein